MTSDLMAKLKKTSTVKAATSLDKSILFNKKDMAPTQVPILNVALSGSMDGGLTSGLSVVAGPSKHYKSNLSLLMASAYMKKYPEAIMLFYDSEFGITEDYLNSFNINPERILHTPIEHVEQLKFDITKQLENIERGQKVVILIDSIGNLASKKELEDALSEKSVADMTRAKALKGLFRIVTPYLTTKDLPMIAINHTYDEIGLFPKKIMGGGCLLAGTKIQMANDTLKNIEDVKEGELVKTLMGDKEVTYTWNPETLDEGVPECYEIEFEDGYTVTCSAAHKFLINDNWVEAKDLEINMLCQLLFTQKENTKKIKSIKKVGRKPVYDISVKDAEHYVLENDVITHNTGIYYSANNIFFMGRQQEKDGKEIAGYNFMCKVEKSRFVKEGTNLPINVMFDKGINKWSGLLEVGLELGYVIKPKNGWYQGVAPEVDKSTGELTSKQLHINPKNDEPKSWRAKDTMCSEFWKPIFAAGFNNAVEERFKLSAKGFTAELEEEDMKYKEVDLTESQLNEDFEE